MRTQDYAIIVIFVAVIAVAFVTVTGLDGLLADVADALGSVTP